MFELHEVQRAAPLPSRYAAPASLDEAAELLSSHGAAARLIAGGTDLMLELARGARSGVELLVDISALGGLDRISYEGGRVTLGSLVTHADVVASVPMLAAGLPLAQACLEVGSPPLRNRATVVGNIVTASPANDTISALVALGADVTMASVRGERTVSINEFFSGFRQTVLEPDEIVTSVAFDALDADDLPTDRRGVFVKLGLRRAQAISVVHAAVVVELDGGRVTDLVVALGSVAPTIITVPAAAELAMGRELAETSADIVAAACRAATPIDDIRGSAEYRMHTVGVVVDRAVAALASGTEADRWPAEPPRLAAASRDRVPRVSVAPDEGDNSSGRPGVGVDVLERASSALDGPGDLVTATVNGEQRTASGAAGKTLMDWLRDDIGLTGTKEGCAEGECGACTVHLDGAAVFSCLVPAGRADGAVITTVEGVASSGGELHPFQRAMVDTGGAQCGFCTPGFVMSAAALLDEVAEPTAEQITIGLSGNLCRCTGYCSIIEAVRAASVDAGAVRAASVDAGAVRAASVDAGAVRAASVDAGAVRAASVDAGAVRAASDAAGDSS
ncbi:FAD binding domain-containing protein [Candidatus Poriferisodalis sp.]|uniref:FAD binding domain-containing protein n=1 Tax=Candidatus Poriferisodalis sp. TaxID=3101277 RepID=UPI003B01279A